jgi:hypothetical protein
MTTRRPGLPNESEHMDVLFSGRARVAMRSRVHGVMKRVCQVAFSEPASVFSMLGTGCVRVGAAFGVLIWQMR